MARIHHNTVKKAASHGIALSVEGDTIVATKGNLVVRHADAKVALEMLLAKLAPAKPVKVKRARKPRDEDEGDDEGGEDEGDELPEGEESDDEESDEGKSVVKRKYKQAYRPFKMTCGDDISVQVSRHVMVKDDGDDKPHLDVKKLYRFAMANDCWSPDYNKLNPGMRRMNVANRLRAKVRKGHKINWAG